MLGVFVRTVRDRRSFVIGWLLGLMFMGYLMTIFFPTFHQDNAMDELVKSLPPAFKGLVGNLNNLKQIGTYIGSQLFEIRIPMMVSILSVILGLGITATEEDKGQLRTFLALPVSRTGIPVAKWLGLVVISGLVTLGVAAGIGLGLLQIRESIDFMVVVRLCAVTWLLIVAFASVVFGVGLATGKRGVTMAVGTFVTAASFLLTMFEPAVDWLAPYERFSLLHYFDAVNVAKDGIDVNNVLVYVAVIGVVLMGGLLAFRRRDVR